MKKQKIELKVFDEICRPSKIKKGDWIDLRSSKDYTLDPGMFQLIDLGIAMKLPAGFEAHIVPRGSTYKNFGVIQTNHCGIVDNTYCGPKDVWKFPALNPSMHNTVHIHRGDRICQFRIVENQPEIEFVDSNLEENEDRGAFGSTGKN